MVWYALSSYRRGEAVRTALVLDGGLYDLADAASSLSNPVAWAQADVDELLSQWVSVGPELDEFAEMAAAGVEQLTKLTIGANSLAPPLRPSRVFCAAANYAKHASEMGTVLAAKAERRPYMFIKPGTSIIGHNDTVVIPNASSQVDWEVELAVVIGRETRHVPAKEALDYVAGYTVINDVTARDLNIRDDYPFKTDWFQGKCFDTFAPLGPWLVPTSCIDDPYALDMRLSVNGELMQEEKTGAMIFDIGEQIEYLSSILTLKPGDVIATGTPTGVGMSRGVYLKPGDVMDASITLIGSLSNPVAADEER
jgi:2-keto-4-pentenoate hydratase/2-oxohepta-3-ene-1,7-dioic acid hydratase in catechol pathway